MAFVSVLVICHDRIGAAIVEAAQTALGYCPVPVQVLSADPSCDPDALLASAVNAVAALDKGAGVLVLTDLYGSTPSNIATRLMGHERVRVVTGVNLPMLIKIFNYSQLPLDEIVAKAISGGRDGILHVTVTTT